ncbi:hybrid sensor histidine kinase/response regulator [Pararobbsia alpina]|uniref:histidine kinase n=1 Tax=Pararobbsia alpina TaxID=621374 RepID=A0A6S7B7R4_9BURK|nr:response regulator [Pararobbsia alpina]CAB3781992.1 Sensor histidine kinase RcsC [Pararobbsia alpina]
MTGTTRNIETDFAAPPRDLDTIRRALRAVLVLAIVLPFGYLTFYGVTDLHRREVQASEGVDRLARVAQEHALKIIDMNAELQARIVEALDSRSGPDIARDQRRVYRWLSRLAGTYPQVSSLSVFDNSGMLLATSRVYPAPAVSIGKREDFQGAREVWPVDYFSVPMRGSVSGLDIFTTSIARLDAQQAFLGVVSVALKRDYFVDFYRELTGSNKSINLSLYRRDGALLVRYPRVALGTEQAPVDPYFAQALRDNTLVGQIVTGSGVDQPDRILAFRRVDDYPLYVSASVDAQSITDAWLSHMLVVIAMMVVPSGVICGLVLFVLRRLAAEEAAWDNWRAGFSMRVASEQAVAQASRMEGFGNLAASIAHDFNNMLMVLSSNLDVARTKRYTGIHTETASIARAIDAGQSITRRLLGIAGKQPLNRENIVLPVWICNSKAIVQEAAGPATQVLYDVRDNTWPVFVDPRELELAIVNVVLNASEAMPVGGQLRIATRNLRLPDGQSELTPGRYVVLSLSDNGRGMSPAVLNRALEPMFSTKPVGTGAGLGLAHVLAFCKQAGGTARIESSEGVGTAVRLYLPGSTGAVATVVELLAGEEVPAAAPGDRRRVLLVEDNVEVAAGMGAVLDLMDCDVTHAVDADEALRLLAEGELFDLILSDIHMPGSMNGIDLAERVRRDTPNLRIVLMTGYAQELDRVNGRFDVLSKPFDLNVLGAIVADLRAHPGL